MDKGAKIYVAGHRGLVGSALVRRLETEGYTNLILRKSDELDLRDQGATASFFSAENPEYVFLAAAKVGGIVANDSYPAARAERRGPRGTEGREGQAPFNEQGVRCHQTASR